MSSGAERAGAERSEASDQVVLLGASNLTRGMPRVIGAARSRLGGPCRFLIAAGHGRSFGAESMLLGRTLPGITECGLWDALDRSADRRRTFALVTDIGNDIFYGHPPGRIVSWVRACVDRLEAAGARIVVTDLPMANVREVGRGRFLLLRTVFFPRCRMSYEAVVEAGHAVSAGLGELAAAGRIELVGQSSGWYGFDAMHIRRRHWPAALGRMLGPWSGETAAGAEAEASAAVAESGLSLGEALRVRLLTPERWRVFGIERGRSQPAGRLADGSTIGLY